MDVFIVLEEGCHDCAEDIIGVRPTLDRAKLLAEETHVEDGHRRRLVWMSDDPKIDGDNVAYALTENEVSQPYPRSKYWIRRYRCD